MEKTLEVVRQKRGFICDMDGVLYHGNRICVLWDKSGKKYNMGKGFSVYLNGEKVFESPKICKFEFDLGGK